MSKELWEAVWFLAEVWRKSPVVRDMSSQLPKTARRADESNENGGVATALQNLVAGFGGMLHPLMLGSRVPICLQQAERFGIANVDEVDMRSWLSAAERVEAAHRSSMAWFRSRLYGYPMLRVPQLARGTSLTTFEFTAHFVWPDLERSIGLQFLDSPQRVAEILRIDDGRGLESAARGVARALEDSSEYREFARSGAALTGSDREQLGTAKRTLRDRLVPEAVDHYEPTLALRRAEFREYETLHSVDDLSGEAAAYASAFMGVVRLLELVLADVFGELVCYGPPLMVSVSQVEFPGNGPYIEYLLNEDEGGPWISAGDLLWLPDSHVADAVRVERSTISVRDEADSGTHRQVAQVLSGTAAAWPS
ncbi:hypothetical protein PZ938_16955 [Luteipulveratus sp. YIM 133132]|uniref:hypothetical protein n=1 Tax=Luteipulveratus flavus TaxID=3031728 RepID=UPI0023B1BE71|nr:hypothetical protein [Luteipulveratus sp. YIM 133132]MDE9367312.1 hypothetical protein [Luteipulveratus sp. YIM 133132]